MLAAGPQGAVARQLGAVRDHDEPYGLAIRAYVESPRHADPLIEACLTVKDEHGTWVPGYGWMFPCGDGTVNIGVGALSTMKGFNSSTSTRSSTATARSSATTWEIGPNLDRPRAWRLPMSAVSGTARAGSRSATPRADQPDERRGHRLRPRVGSARSRPVPRRPGVGTQEYDRQIGERFDGFLRTGRRFAFLIGHPRLMRTGLRFAVGTRRVARHHAASDGQPRRLVNPGAAGRTMRVADRALALADRCYEEPRPRLTPCSRVRLVARRLRWGRCGEAQIA